MVDTAVIYVNEYLALRIRMWCGVYGLIGPFRYDNMLETLWL